MAATTLPPRGPRSARAWGIFSLILLFALLRMHSVARADDLEEHRIVDASLLTCGDVERLTLPRALVTIGWVGGFYAGLKNDTRVDIPIFVDRAERVISFCRENQSMRLMAVVEQELHRDDDR
jgi:hypothetical protein